MDLHGELIKRAAFGLVTAFVLCALVYAAPAASPGWQGASVAVPGGSYLNVAPAALDSMLRSKDFLLVNVHVPYEGEIRLTDALVPYDKTAELLKVLPADRKARIVLYCRSGRMSDIAARFLVKHGYTNLANLEGGMIAWEQAALPIEQKQR